MLVAYIEYEYGDRRAYAQTSTGAVMVDPSAMESSYRPARRDESRVRQRFDD